MLAVAEVTNELIYEILKNMQDRMGRMEERLGELKFELNSIRGHIAAIQNDVTNVYSILGRQDDRLEKRLDLVDMH